MSDIGVGDWVEGYHTKAPFTEGALYRVTSVIPVRPGMGCCVCGLGVTFGLLLSGVPHPAVYSGRSTLESWCGNHFRPIRNGQEHITRKALIKASA